ncbi:MAG: DUF3500 domain-containing protein [Pseudomonadota bacterium]
MSGGARDGRPVGPFSAYPDELLAGPATAFVATQNLFAALTPEQRERAVLPIDSELRRNWSNLPSGITDFARNGLRFGDLDDAQRVLGLRVLAAALGRRGYGLASDIVAADRILGDTIEGPYIGWSDANYWLAFFGEPSTSEPWGLQFGGHHLAINLSYDDGQVVSASPGFFGIEPATFALDEREFSPFDALLDDAVAFAAALPVDQLAAAAVGERPDEVFAGAQRDGFVPPIEGLSAALLDASRRDELLGLVAHFVRLQPPGAAARRLDEIESSMDQLRLVWLGGTNGAGELYFRIQGPRLLVEFSTEGAVGADGGHYHAVYRDFELEYGGQLDRATGG